MSAPTALPWIIGRNTSSQVSLFAPRHLVEPTVLKLYGSPETPTPVATFRGDFRVENARFVARAVEVHEPMLKVLIGLNHMVGDERGGYCICPRHDGSAPDKEHSTSCAEARAVVAMASAP